MDRRKALEVNSILVLGTVSYIVKELVGCGANAMVYKAVYEDLLLPGKNHIVLIKELFPFEKEGAVFRDENNCITCKEQAADYFELHKKSFLRGNAAHLSIQQERPDKAAVNINSYIQNGTLYSIIGYSGGKTLKEMIQDGKPDTLYNITACMINILSALQPFHKNGMLHLDISPDNILLMPLDSNKSECFRDVLLIDYNSVWEMEELTNHTGLYYSIKENYSAPELELHDNAFISPASDIFSVCAVFYELIQGEPLRSETLTNNKKGFDTEKGKLKNCPATVRYKALSILKHGLKLPPAQRYQSIEEILSDLEELLNRIDGIGVTHSALWEASALEFHEKIASDPAYSYLNDMSYQGKIDLQNSKNSMIISNYDSNKENNTELLYLWKNGVKKYNPGERVPVYISLYRCSGDNCYYIRTKIMQQLKFDSTKDTYHSAMHRLNHLLNTEIDGKPSVLLLLDGLSETRNTKNSLLLEINELTNYKGVQIVLTIGNAIRTEHGFDRGMYSLLKLNFSFFLRNDRNELKLIDTKHSKGRENHYIEAALLIFLLIILIAGIKLYAKSFPSEDRMTQKQTNTVNMALNGLVYSIGILDMQFLAENNILDSAIQNLQDDGSFNEEKFVKQSEKELEAVVTVDYDKNQNDLVLEYLTKSDSAVPLPVFNELYLLPEKNISLLRRRTGSLTEYLSLNNVYSTDDKRKVIALYQRYLENEADIIIIKIYQILEQLSLESRDIILDYLPYTNILKDNFVNSGWTSKNFKTELEACRTTHHDMIVNMNQLNFNIETGETSEE